MNPDEQIVRLTPHPHASLLKISPTVIMHLENMAKSIGLPPASLGTVVAVLVERDLQRPDGLWSRKP